MVITFGIILIFSSLREGFEDYQRYKKDKKANEKMFHFYDDSDLNEKKIQKKESKKIHVGDVMKIFKGEEFPADMCLLKSSNKNGICFVDTVNLDGESNLKDKRCNSILQEMSDTMVCEVSGILNCDHPNEVLDYWEGYLNIYSEHIIETKISLE
jgi:P-type E1-E2 ATPase